MKQDMQVRGQKEGKKRLAESQSKMTQKTDTDGRGIHKGWKCQNDDNNDNITVKLRYW
jgi:hypothetical protein